MKWIAVCGNIASGKTTLARMLSSHYNWQVKFESVDNNPYLDDFYNNMDKFAFETQIYFMNKRVEDILKIKDSKDITIQDRILQEDRYVFVPTLYEQKHLSKRSYDNYCELYNSIEKLTGRPDLLIYIRSSISNLVNQMDKRGRVCESNMSLAYLKLLNDKYENFINNYKGNLIIIDGDKFKFENNENDFKIVTELIDANLEV